MTKKALTALKHITDAEPVKYGIISPKLGRTYQEGFVHGFETAEANSVDLVLFLTMIQNSSGAPESPIWGDEWLEWYEADKWLNQERALAIFIGMKMWNADAKRTLMNAKAIDLKINCWCEACDTAKNSGLRTRMSLCPDCGDKRCAKALYHNNSCKRF